MPLKTFLRQIVLVLVLPNIQVSNLLTYINIITTFLINIIGNFILHCQIYFVLLFLYVKFILYYLFV